MFQSTSQTPAHPSTLGLDTIKSKHLYSITASPNVNITCPQPVSSLFSRESTTTGSAASSLSRVLTGSTESAGPTSISTTNTTLLTNSRFNQLKSTIQPDIKASRFIVNVPVISTSNETQIGTTNHLGFFPTKLSRQWIQSSSNTNLEMYQQPLQQDEHNDDSLSDNHTNSQLATINNAISKVFCGKTFLKDTSNPGTQPGAYPGRTTVLRDGNRNMTQINNRLSPTAAVGSTSRASFFAQHTHLDCHDSLTTTVTPLCHPSRVTTPPNHKTTERFDLGIQEGTPISRDALATFSIKQVKAPTPLTLPIKVSAMTQLHSPKICSSRLMGDDGVIHEGKRLSRQYSRRLDLTQVASPICNNSHHNGNNNSHCNKTSCCHLPEFIRGSSRSSKSSNNSRNNKSSNSTNHISAESILQSMDKQLKDLVEQLPNLFKVEVSQEAEFSQTTKIHVTPKPTRSVFSGWEVINLLGSGTFASVYKIKDVRTGELGAAKLYSVICQCPGVVGIKHIVRGVEGWLIVQDLIDGGTLWEDFECNNDLEKFSLFLQLIQTVLFMQDKNVVHRDLKPTNILRSSDGSRLWVADFGWSEHYNDINKYLHELPGTIEINPPEVLTHQLTQSEKIDNYALGMNLMLLCTHQFVCRNKELNTNDAANNILENIATIQKGRPPRGFSSQSWNIFLGLSEFNPLRRYTLQQVIESPWFISLLSQLLPTIPTIETMSNNSQLQKLNHRNKLSSFQHKNFKVSPILWHWSLCDLANRLQRYKLPRALDPYFSRYSSSRDQYHPRSNNSNHHSPLTSSLGELLSTVDDSSELSLYQSDFDEDVAVGTQKSMESISQLLDDLDDENESTMTEMGRQEKLYVFDKTSHDVHETNNNNKYASSFNESTLFRHPQCYTNHHRHCNNSNSKIIEQPEDLVQKHAAINTGSIFNLLKETGATQDKEAYNNNKIIGKDIQNSNDLIRLLTSSSVELSPIHTQEKGDRLCFDMQSHEKTKQEDFNKIKENSEVSVYYHSTFNDTNDGDQTVTASTSTSEISQEQHGNDTTDVAKAGMNSVYIVPAEREKNIKWGAVSGDSQLNEAIVLNELPKIDDESCAKFQSPLTQDDKKTSSRERTKYSDPHAIRISTFKSKTPTIGYQHLLERCIDEEEECPTRDFQIDHKNETTWGKSQYSGLDRLLNSMGTSRLSIQKNQSSSVTPNSCSTTCLNDDSTPQGYRGICKTFETPFELTSYTVRSPALTRSLQIQKSSRGAFPHETVTTQSSPNLVAPTLSEGYSFRSSVINSHSKLAHGVPQQNRSAQPLFLSPTHCQQQQQYPVVDRVISSVESSYEQHLQPKIPVVSQMISSIEQYNDYQKHKTPVALQVPPYISSTKQQFIDSLRKQSSEVYPYHYNSPSKVFSRQQQLQSL